MVCLFLIFSNFYNFSHLLNFFSIKIFSGFVDVTRLDFSTKSLEMGFLTKLMNQMYKTDAIAIHPVLSYDSSTSYSFMKTQTRVASQHYRNELDESNCCSQVWILGQAVLPLYDSAWFKSIGGMDVQSEYISGYV